MPKKKPKKLSKTLSATEIPPSEVESTVHVQPSVTFATRLKSEPSLMRASSSQLPKGRTSLSKLKQLARSRSGLSVESEELSDDEEEEEEPEELKGRKRVLERLAKRRELKLEQERILREQEAALMEKEPEKPKKKPKDKPPKKKSKAQEKAEAKLAEELAKQAAIDEALAAEQERIMILAQTKAGREKERISILEQTLRTEQLANSCAAIRNIIRSYESLQVEEKEEEDWQHYIRCDGEPKVADPREMTTYLHIWNQSIDETTVDETSKNTLNVMNLLQKLGDLLDDPVDGTRKDIEHWKWIRSLFRESLQRSLDQTTYLLLRDIDRKMDRINLETATFKHEQEHFALSIWLRVKWPTFYPNPRRPPLPRINVEFIEGRFEALFPFSIDCNCMALRAMHLNYDHLSDTSENYNPPDLPVEFSRDLFGATTEEWRAQLQYKYEKYKSKQSAIVEGAPEIEQIVPTEIPILPFQLIVPSASTYVLSEEDNRYEEHRNKMQLTLDEDIINLRKYQMLGGIYYLHLYYQPPQPKHIVIFDMLITRLMMPLSLREVEFYVDYEEPQPPQPGVIRTPEEIEEEIKKTEAELETMILITIHLPNNVMWLDTPVVGLWDPQYKIWSNDSINDLKHIEEQNVVTFRTAEFGIFGIGMLRYCNLPYQAWEIKPEIDGSVTLQLTAAILMIDFNVRADGLIALTALQNAPNNALKDIMGVYIKLPKLRRIMKNAGVDVFPEHDAFCYVENSCEKHWPMEKHLYYNMAQTAVAFNFAWSRWNVTAGRRKAVLQMRTYKPESTKQTHHNMLLVTPLKAQYVDCNEVSPTFDETPLENMKFFADVMHLMRSTVGFVTKAKVQGAPQSMVKVFADLLISVRVLSFS